MAFNKYGYSIFILTSFADANDCSAVEQRVTSGALLKETLEGRAANTYKESGSYYYATWHYVGWFKVCPSTQLRKTYLGQLNFVLHAVPHELLPNVKKVPLVLEVEQHRSLGSRDIAPELQYLVWKRKLQECFR